ncbi:DgyrCDS5392 [Dimorphilus gyrociliatus]|uniref:DgyrCDS5392 n=1 Tax=Dimorphilus gyrociliatus TaxID=2664684 RepID=A0A7I8VLD9_9ANNE|nr:DgyrCDS5392 [Dimorphilus gyrociliatus]
MTEWGKKYKFNSIKDYDDFYKLHPITEYNDYSDYIYKISAKRQNVLSKKDVIYFAKTSGTTGKPKIIPVTSEMKRYGMSNIGPIIMYNVYKGTNGKSKTLHRVLGLYYGLNNIGSIKDINSGAVVCHLRPDRLYKFGVTPPGGFLIAHEKSALHVHAVFALRDKDIGEINALFASTVYYFWKYLDEHWELVCSDINNGILNENLLIDDKIRKELNSQLSPNRKRALEIKSIFNGPREELAKRIWPNLIAVKMITSGTFSIYYKAMKKIYMKNIDTYSLIHSCNECHIGIGAELAPDSCVYILNANYAFFEFIHEKDAVINRLIPILPSDVTIGENYEVVVTNNSGLYRYRTGDLITIVSKKPYFTYKLLNRRQSVLNVKGRFLSENTILEIVELTAIRLNKIIIDTILIPNIRKSTIVENYYYSSLPHYILFIELIDGGNLTREEKLMFDIELRKSFNVYDKLRQNDEMDKINVICTRKNTFNNLRQILKQENNMAFKMPRLELEREDIIQFLIENRQ